VIEYETTLIRKYENFIREVINLSVNKIDFEKLEKQQKMFVDKIRELFKFQTNESWSFLTSSLDTLGDSHFAIVSFLNNNIDNGKIFNTGEKYLRLYGVLSSVYIHFRSVSTLAELTKVKTADLEKDYNKLDISFLRNAISAHPVSYELNGKKTNFKIARFSINDTGILNIVNNKNEFKAYDLYKSINEYIRFAERTLKTVSKKNIEVRYKSSIDKKRELIDRLEELRS